MSSKPSQGSELGLPGVRLSSSGSAPFSAVPIRSCSPCPSAGAADVSPFAAPADASAFAAPAAARASPFAPAAAGASPFAAAEPSPFAAAEALPFAAMAAISRQPSELSRQPSSLPRQPSGAQRQASVALPPPPPAGEQARGPSDGSVPQGQGSGAGFNSATDAVLASFQRMEEVQRQLSRSASRGSATSPGQLSRAASSALGSGRRPAPSV